jgi:hypothetical protein
MFRTLISYQGSCIRVRDISYTTLPDEIQVSCLTEASGGATLTAQVA